MKLLDDTSIETYTGTSGTSLREAVLKSGAVHFVLDCLKNFTQQDTGVTHGPEAAQMKSSVESQKSENVKHFWPKGTGYGSGYGTGYGTGLSSKEVTKTNKQTQEEESVVAILKVG